MSINIKTWLACMAALALPALAFAADVKLPVGELKSFQVTTPGYTDRYLRQTNSLGYTAVVSTSSSESLRKESSFRIVSGLANGNCYSLESQNLPGRYLRHFNSRIRLDSSDNSDTFKRDATWCARPGLSGQGVSFESLNFGGRYLRHANSELWNDPNTGGSFAQDASWNVVNALSANTCSNSTGSVTGGGPKEVRLKNNTGQTIRVAFFRNLAPGENPSFNGPDASFNVPPGCTQKVAVPRDWQGRAQRYSGSTQDPSNWAELNFEPGEKAWAGMDRNDKIWFDESDILGRNSSLLMVAGDGVVGGIAKSVVGEAPSNLVVRDSSGQLVIKPPQWFNGVTNWDAVNFLRAKVGADKAYVLPDDHGAVRLSHSSTMTLEFGNP